jgi:coenzyme F420-reducing hydrogenase delta subunit
MLKELNIEPERVKLDWFSTGESAKLTKSIDDFIKKLEKLGPIKKMEESKKIGG